MRLFARRAAAAPARYTMELPVYSDDGGGFGAVRNRRVLVYWPHGFGDFIHLSHVVPLLEPSNDYFITRFGDDFVHVYDESPTMRPLYSGSRALSDGSPFGSLPHFGLDMDHPPDGVTRLDVPEPLKTRVESSGIDALLVCRYPEMTGRTPYPWHTKARYLASRIISNERLAGIDLTKPLRSALAFDAPSPVREIIEDRLRAFAAPGTRLYVVSSGGHTQLEKIWPESEVVAFAREVRRRDARARVLTIDERTSDSIGRERGIAPTTTDLFGDLDVPFAHVLTTSIRASHAYAGVASGPLHCAIAIGGRPIAGVWFVHWPEYYDEPSSDVVHLVGPEVYRRKLDRRLGAVTLAHAGAAPHRIEAFRQRRPSSSDVLDALERV